MSRWLEILYRGRRVAVELVPIDDQGHELEAAAAQAWRLMRLAAELDGVQLRARTAFRSYEHQRLLRQRYEEYSEYVAARARWEAGGKVGPEPARVRFAALANEPSTSTHEIGNAIDVAGAAQVGGAIDLWLRANAARYGWRHTVLPAEPWHLNFVPG